MKNANATRLSSVRQSNINRLEKWLQVLDEKKGEPTSARFNEADQKIGELLEVMPMELQEEYKARYNEIMGSVHSVTEYETR